MKKIKQISTICLLIFIFTILQLPMIAANEEGNIAIDVTYGFEKNIKIGKHMPVTVNIKNNGPDFEGVVEVEVPRNNNEVTVYKKNISFPQNTEKEVSLSIPVQNNIGSIKVNVKNTNGKLIKDNSFNIDGRRVLTNSLLIGVLSDDYSSLMYLQENSILSHIYSPRTFVDLSRVHLPEDVLGLGALDVIIINNYNTSNISNEQYDAIKQWVKNGGHLIIGTGPTYNKTLSIFEDDFLSGDIRSANTIETNFNHEALMPINLHIQDIIMNEGEDVFADGLVRKIQRGNGVILLTLFDLGLEPLVSYHNNVDFAALLFNNTISNEYLYNAQVDNRRLDGWRLSSYLSMFPDVNLPKMSTIVIIIMIYLLIVGPLIYFIAKKLDKREFLWIGVPAIAIIFTGIIFSFGGSTRFTQPIINRGNIIMLNNSDDVINIESYVGIISPRARNLLIEVPNDKSPALLANHHNYYSNNTNKIVHSVITVDRDITNIEIKNTQAFNPNFLSMVDTFELEGGIHSNLSFDLNGISGTLTNNLGHTLEDVFIYGNRMFSLIGNIEEGEKTITSKLNSVFNYYDVMNMVYPNRWNRSNVNVSEQIKVRQRSNFMEQFLETIERSGDNKIYLMGFYNVTEESNIRINNKKQYENNLNMVIIPIELAINEGGEINFPLGYFMPTPIYNGIDKHDYDHMNNIFFGDEIELSYHFYENLELEKIKFENNILTSRFGSFGGDVYIYNYFSEGYELFDYINETIEGDRLDEVINELNQLQIKLVQPQNQGQGPTHYATSVPLIGVQGRLN
ncbi:hypothetical protein EDC18_103267 [Natranaerovirga pectinivora]|uniref:Uncharacterized protein n=1 Tax=Natranaerovirga pectinivora TaxID=682400 RepID=A0A4R3MQV4_9FIRM|nr:hypothetical protein [Natranaerovirga pectinivora]TCT15561.1 hypothetical protein EDC18_103267 [Natranaerovirga pectinivora]